MAGLQVKRSINHAERILAKMERSEALDEYISHWEDFLIRLELIWEKIRKHYGNYSFFQSTYSEFGKLQKKDPLLRYLKQARNAVTHTISEMTSSNLGLHIRGKGTRPFYIDGAEITVEGQTLKVDLNTVDVLFEPEVTITRDKPRLVRFKTRGKWYNPPVTHLGNIIEGTKPDVVGAMGLAFVKGLYEQLEAKL